MHLINGFPKDMNTSNALRRAHGFTILQMVITIVIIGIVSTFALLGINSTRASLRLQNSVRQPSSLGTSRDVDNNTLDCAGTSGGGGPPVSGGGPECTDTANPSSISLRNNGGGSADGTVTATNTGTIGVAAPITLRVTPST